MNETNLFDQIKALPMADLNVIERLEGLEPDNMEMFEPNRLIVDYFWHFPDGRIRSQIILDWHLEKQYICLYVVSNNSPRFFVELVCRPGDCNCIYADITGREWPLEPEEFWQQLAFILDLEEGPNPKRRGFMTYLKEVNNGKLE